MSHNLTLQSVSEENAGGVNPGSNQHVMHISCTPLPSCANTNLSSGNPAVFIYDGGEPPSYEEVINPNAPPPSYDSLFSRMCEAHKTSKDIQTFLLNIVLLLVGTIGCTIIVGLAIVVPICMMVIGGIYLHDCPQSEYIPVYLLVGGAFGIFKQLLDFEAHVRKSQEERDEESIRRSPTQTLINYFLLGWFIIGSMWVYKEYEPNYDPALGNYCNKTVYLFAFWFITCNYIFIGVIITCFCAIAVASIVFH